MKLQCRLCKDVIKELKCTITLENNGQHFTTDYGCYLMLKKRGAVKSVEITKLGVAGTIPLRVAVNTKNSRSKQST